MRWLRRDRQRAPTAAVLRAVTAAVACAFVQASAAADVFWFAEDDGSLQLSNVPADPRFRKLVSSPDTPVYPDTSVVPAWTGARSRSGYAIRGLPQPRLDTRSIAGVTTSARQFDEIIDEAARLGSIEGSLLRAVIAVESAFDPRAVSHKGARGLMQLMPATAQRFGVTDPFDPKQNVEAGARYLSGLLKIFGGDLSLALAAYNAGEANVARYGNTVPPFAETQNYVPKVLGKYRQYLQAD